MELKNKIIDEINSVVEDYKIVSEEFNNVNPTNSQESKVFEDSRVKKIKLTAIATFKSRLFIKIYTLNSILKDYFNTDISNSYPVSLSEELKEYDRITTMLSIKDSRVNYGEEFEKYINEFEENIKRLKSNG